MRISLGRARLFDTNTDVPTVCSAPCLTRLPENMRAIIPFGINEPRSGISWKYANEGSKLVSRSMREATSTSQETELTRRLYVDGVAYLLRGLPTNLTAEERIKLSGALPPQVKPHQRPDTSFSLDSDTLNERMPCAIPITRTYVSRWVELFS